MEVASKQMGVRQPRSISLAVAIHGNDQPEGYVCTQRSLCIIDSFENVSKSLDLINVKSLLRVNDGRVFEIALRIARHDKH